MKESNSVRLKMAVGYLVVALLGVTAAVGVWRQIAPLMIEDDSQKLLQRRRMLVSQTLYHLYEAESCGQMLLAGYPDYRERYTGEVEQVHRDIDSLREWTEDSVQRIRLDTLERLLREKVDGVLALDSNLRASSESALLHKNIRQIVPLLDSMTRHERHDTLVVRDTMRLMPRRKRNFFRRFGDLFSPPKADSQLVVTTHVEIDTLPRDLSGTITSVLQVLERRVVSEHLALYDKARQEGLQLERNNRQVDRRIYRLIVDFEEEETAYLWDRIRSLGEVRRQALRVMVSVMGGLFLVVLFFVGMLWRDITRSDRYKRRLERANDRNEVLIEEREKLMLAVTHDIKAPLGAIMGYIDLMTRTEKEKGCRIYLHRMKEAADRLLGLVTDLLDFYRLDANKISVSRIVFSPAELFTAVCESFEPQAGEKGIALRCKLAPELSRRVEGDSSRIRQIVENLLSNAIKFTDRGFVAFESWMEGERLYFRVSDTGRGIAPDERDRIFREFVRLPSAEGASGVGLGLSIVDRLVKLLQGRVELESEQGAGSRFTVWIPVREMPEAVAEESGAEHPADERELRRSDGKRFRCLWIDDDPLQLEMTAAQCRYLGMETESCNHPEYADRLVCEFDFDLVFTDIQMPSIDGFEVLRRIRTVRPELPVVAVTARSDDREIYLVKGFADVLNKPFARAELAALLCGRFAAVTADAAPEESSVQAGPEGLEVLASYAPDDPEAIRAIMRTFVTENERHVERLRRAVAVRDDDEIRAVAHKMLPVFTMLGEEELVAGLRRLERSEGVLDGMLRDEALHAAERVVKIVDQAKKEYLCTE